jgi:hypothetical protein
VSGDSMAELEELRTALKVVKGLGSKHIATAQELEHQIAQIMAQKGQLCSALQVVNCLGHELAATAQVSQRQIAQIRNSPDDGTCFCPCLEPNHADGRLVIPTCFRFLDLSLELREMIYDLCLAVGKVMFAQRPYPDYDRRLEDGKDYRKPVLQLLHVNRQIRKESAKRLFQTNHFILGEDYLAWSFMLPKFPGQTETYYLRRWLLSRVSIWHS